jgi:hypothetical protein
MIKDFYSILYRFYNKREDEFMSWFYTLGILGFLITLNIISALHLFMAWKKIWIEEILYIIIFLTPLALFFLYFYTGKKDEKKSRLLHQHKIQTSSKVGFLLYVLLTKIILVYTLILWGTSANY